MEKMRINKYLSMAGVCSRRQGDKAIEEGQVLINGRVAVMGDKVDENDEVIYNGKMVKPESSPVLIAFNKPRGLVCTTAKSENGKKIKNVVDYINYPTRIYPVGRLDKESEGLLLLTNQGELVNKVLKSRNFHEKEYVVLLNKEISDADINRLSKGVHLVDREKDMDLITRPCKVKRISENEVNIVLTQGVNRQIRRMCLALGYRVKRLKRIRIMDVELGNLEPGKYREVKDSIILK